MKKTLTTIPMVLALLLPFAASAHEHASFLIGGKQYDIVIGSLNEPIIVDDKTGLDLRVSSGGTMEMAEDGDMEPTGGSPAIGLENDLKVELIAGDKRMTQELSPAYGEPGAYHTTYYPTVATTMAYRLFGTIDGTPVDITFPCLPEGSEAEEQGEKEISAGVKQLMIGGGFGCPAAKEDFGFPEKSVAVVSASQDASQAAAESAAAARKGTWGIGFGVAGIALGAAALLRRRN